MTAPTDAERAREIVRGVRFDCPAACNGDDDERCAYCGDDRGPLIHSIAVALAAVRAEERERAAREEPTPEYFARAALDAAAHALAEATLLVETSETKHTGACRSRRFVQNTECARCQEIDAQRDGLDLYREARLNLDAIRRQEGRDA